MYEKKLCYVMLCYVMLCYVMLCYVMLCYVMLCYNDAAARNVNFGNVRTVTLGWSGRAISWVTFSAGASYFLDNSR